MERVKKTIKYTPEQQIIITKWRTNNIPEKHNGAYRRTYDKAIKHQSMKAAVSAKCLDCSNWQVLEIKQCDITTCPLWSYRPYGFKSAAPRGQ